MLTASPGAHHVTFHHTAPYAVERLMTFVIEGLVRQERVVVIVESSRHAELLAALEDEGAECARSAQHGHLIWIDAHQVLSGVIVNGSLDRELAAQRFAALMAGPQRVRVYGETASMLMANGCVDAALELEAIGTELIARHGAVLLCGYAAAGLPVQTLEHLCSVHARTDHEGA